MPPPREPSGGALPFAESYTHYDAGAAVRPEVAVRILFAEQEVRRASSPGSECVSGASSAARPACLIGAAP